MDKTFDPHAIETPLYSHWESSGYFEPSGKGEPYCIMLPPPNVTGRLHMGHAFQQTLMDTLIRFRRMQGRNTLWQPGSDHAGIATQMVVERQLEAEGSSRTSLGREVFLKRVWQWKDQSGDFITQQMRRLGASPDWSRYRFTMDHGLSDAVKKVFIDLYKEDLIYRGKRLVNWDPKLHTAISDIEVENKDKQGQIWHFRYPLANGAKTKEGKDFVVVATTRPETMLGDTAVAVHPEDERYQHLIGQTISLPLVDRQIPIIADEYIDPEFGTGCVKITPAHDFNDYEVGKRHQLPMISVLDESALIRSQTQTFDTSGQPQPELDAELPESLIGTDRFEARKEVVKQFDSLGLLDTTEPHALKLPICERSGVVIEPLLMDQWYVRTTPLAKPAIEAVESGEMQFVPKQWENSFFAWMRDIQDWCISRQLWWGHRIPAWYDHQGNVYVGEDEASVRNQHNLDAEIALSQDEDVLDTWFSSALWTFSTLGWPENTEALETWNPSSVLVTGFDIIFFWVARMMMMTLKFRKQLPFKKVYMHGLVRDGQGHKMSKSKGNVLDPLDLIDGITLENLVTKRTSGLMQPQMKEKIEKATRKEFPEGIAAYGTDALRFTFCSLASTGRDIKFDFNRLEGYRNFCNKLWNASRYVITNCHEQNNGLDGNGLLGAIDYWIIHKTERAQHEVVHALEEFRFDHAANALYEFVWNEYCDWYLELTKPVLYSKDPADELRQQGTRHTLLHVLESTLRLAHPLIPFVTDAIWQHLKPLLNLTDDTVMLTRYPNPEPLDRPNINHEACEAIEWLKLVITAIRTIRSELTIAPGKTLSILLQHGSDIDRKRIEAHQVMLRKLAKIESIQWLATDDTPPIAALELVDELKVYVPLKGLIDKEAELARLSKEKAKLEKEAKRLQAKMNNPNFIDKAPAEVVTKEKSKWHETTQALNELNQQTERLALL